MTTDERDGTGIDAVMGDPRELRTAPPFSTLFPIAPATLDAITRRMRGEGFRASHPIEVWRQGNVVVDGHTRRLAAIAAGVRDVPVIFLDFDDEDAALDYAKANQRDRRNLGEAEILSLVEAEHKPKGRGRRAKLASTEANSGKSAAETAAAIGVSRAKVERSLVVLRDPVAKAAVLAGEKTISRAAGDVAAKRREQKPRKAKPEPDAPRLVPLVPPPMAMFDPNPEDAAFLALDETINRALASLPADARGGLVAMLSIRIEELMDFYGVRREVADDPPRDSWDDEHARIVSHLDGLYEGYPLCYQPPMFITVAEWLQSRAEAHDFHAKRHLNAMTEVLSRGCALEAGETTA